MYICSILPQNGIYKTHKTNLLFETTATWAWNSSVLTENFTIDDEWILTFRGADSTVLGSLMSTHIRPLFGDVMLLLQSALVIPKFVFHKRISIETLQYIRLFTKDEVPTDISSVKFIKNEISLLRILKHAFIEPMQFANKKLKVYDLIGSSKVYISPTNSICLKDLQINAAGHFVKTKAFPLIVAHKNANRVHTCMSIASNTIPRNWSVLVITDEPDVWLKKCQLAYATTLVDTIISDTDLSSFNVFILAKQNVEQVLNTAAATVASFSDALQIVVGTKPSNEQVLRFLNGHFCQRFSKHTKPLSLHTWTTVIFDDMVPSTDFKGENIIATTLSSKMKLESPSIQQLSKIYDLSVSDINILYSPLVRCIQYVEIPKALLRKVKLRVDTVKYTVAESRLHAMQTIKEIPYDLRHSLRRLSQFIWTVQILDELIRDIFDTNKESLAKLLVPSATFTAQKDHVIQALHNHDAECCICFDKCTEQRIMTLCGHSFCKDCSVQTFHPLRDATATIDCPYCRMKVSVGDLFTIQKTGGMTKMPLLSKEYAVEVLSKGNVNFIIDEKGHLGSPTQEFPTTFVSSKINIVIVSIVNVEKVSNWLLSFANEHTVRVTILEGPKDKPWVNDLQECFRA